MGRVETNQDPQSFNQSQFEPSQHHDEEPPPTQDRYIIDNEGEVLQQQPTPETYSTQKPTTYPPQQAPQLSAAYPPHQLPPGAYPSQQAPHLSAAYPPHQPPPEAYPPQKPTTYPPQQPQQHPGSYPPQRQPVAFPPPSPQMDGAPQPYSAQNYNYTQTSQQQTTVNYEGQVGYQIPVTIGTQEGIPIGNEYLDPTKGWSSDLFACMDDPENAIITACFPCVTFGQIAEMVDHGQTSCTTSGVIYCVIAAFIGIPCLMSCSYRTKIRNRYGLMETPAPDWITHCFCEWCALCQEYRELKAQGIDPALGWQGNFEKTQHMQYNPTMAPPPNQTMMP